MPKFVIERQYLVPMFQHIVVKAETLEEACKTGISDDIDWDTQEMDCDGARKTTLTFVKEIPAGLGETQGILCDRSENPDRPLAIARPAARDPREIHQRRIIRHAPSTAVEGAYGVGPSGIATC
jgi:hypothetical protein